MSRSLLAAVATTAVIAGSLGLAAPSQATPGVPGTPGAPGPLTVSANRPYVSTRTSGFTPRGLAAKQPVRAVVTFTGTSVSEREVAAQAAGQPVNATTKRRDRVAVAASQDATVRAMQSSGARVERRYTDAVSGAAVTGTPSQLAAIAALPGVVSVDPVRTYRPTNTVSNNFTGASAAWTAYSTAGAGQKIAIIDTGIDYGHADFGGPGTAAYYTSNDRTIIEQSHPFPSAKVIGGWDFVGDAYDGASLDPAIATPVPDPDPLDCMEHGTHVAGTAGGSGVTQGGATYTGAYTQAAVDSANLLVPPGSAPQASLLAYKVFGCAGSVGSDVLIAAIDRAVSDGATVINMSIGSAYGAATGTEQTAIANAVAAGIPVIVAAANDGSTPYLVGAPSSAPAALSVAAMDARATVMGATLTSGATSIALTDSDNSGASLGSTPVHVLSDGAGGIGLGCSAADYTGSTGTIVVAKRGVCARADRAVLGQAAGALGVILVNTSPNFPPNEGPIAGVTIPFWGATSTDGATLITLNTASATVTSNPTMTNPEFRTPADFTSSGPRNRDSGVKPDVSAPGVSLISAKVGSGFEPLTLSGTSMATPHTAGIAALVRATNPTWTAQQVKNALVNTASQDPSVMISPNGPRISGNGVVQPLQAMVATIQLQAANTTGDTGLSFGVREGTSLEASARVRLSNLSNVTRTVTLTASAGNGASLTVSPRTVRVRPGSTTVEVNIRMSQSAVAALPTSCLCSLPLVTGRITATTPGVPTATLPVQVVQENRADVRTSARVSRNGGSITATNRGANAGDALLFEWLLTDGRDPAAWFDTRALGALSFAAGLASPVTGDRIIDLALAAHNRFSNAGDSEYDIWLDTTGDAVAEYLLVGADYGLLTAGASDGNFGVWVLDLNSGLGPVYEGAAPPDGSTIQMAFFASDLGLPAQVRILNVDAYPIFNDGVGDFTATNVTFAPSNPQRAGTTGIHLTPGARGTFTLTSRAPLAGEVRSPGWMVVTQENRSGSAQADLVPAGR